MKKNSDKKILFISGSPRSGNTEYVISRLLDLVKGDNEAIFLREKNIKRCKGCLACHSQPICPIKDDDVHQIMNQVINADILVVGSPNYFENVSGLMKDFIDRLHPLYKNKVIKGKKAVLFMVGGGKALGNSEVAKSSMHGFIKHYELELVQTFGFQALGLNDLKKDSSNEEIMVKMAQIINEL